MKTKENTQGTTRGSLSILKKSISDSLSFKMSMFRHPYKNEVGVRGC